jgi:capsular polysaccharide transport system permease protein
MDIEANRAEAAIYRASLSQVLVAQGRVLHALMLRDIHTRFGSAFGFLLVIAWPLTHIVALVAINVLAGRVAPYGDNAALWFATGIVPFMCFSYMSRFTMMGIALNKPLLSFPAITITDILFARALVELLNASLVIIIVAIIFYFLGIDFAPANTQQAAYAILASILLGLGFGVINGIVAAMIPFWITVYNLSMIVMWIGSGVLFVPDALPAQLRDALALQPWLQIVEWMRSAYFEGYGVEILNKSYVLAWGGATLFLGLAFERVFRGRMLT